MIIQWRKGKTYLEFIIWFKACKINEVNGSRAWHEVNRQSEDEDPKGSKNSGKVVTRIFPKLLPKVFFAEASNLSTEDHQKNRYGQQVYAMVYQIMVTQFNVLEVNGLKKIRQTPPNPDGEGQGPSVWPRRLNPTVHNLRREQITFTGHDRWTMIYDDDDDTVSIYICIYSQFMWDCDCVDVLYL